MRRSILVVAAAAVAACGGDTTVPTGVPATLQLTEAQAHALDSTAAVIVQANPSNASVKSLSDSVLSTITAGVELKHIDVSTDLTTAPLYFVGIHRVFNKTGGGSWATWTVIAMDDPAKLTSMIEVAAYADGGASPAPSAISGAIGSGYLNARLWRIATGGAVTEWNSTSGTMTLTSNATTGGCPGLALLAHTVCELETMNVMFSASATGSGGSRQASLTTSTQIPAIRLTYTP